MWLQRYKFILNWARKNAQNLCIFNIKARFARMGFGSNEQRGVRK